MNVTVVLCTYNRAASLATALDSVAAQVVPNTLQWEVIVVDNNSADQTAEVVGDYCRRYPGRFRYKFERNQGLSRARNAGVLEAHGEIVAFIDDDVIADPSWLRNLTEPLLSGKWAGGGGRILPPDEFHPPEWLTVGGDSDLLGALLPLFDLGNESGEMKGPPYGANMAFRRSMFDKYGGFRVDLGRCGNNCLMGEDTDFGYRLMSAGEALRYEPGAVVYHPVPEDRLSKQYFRKWWFDFGRTRIIGRPSRAKILGIPREYISIANLALHRLPVRTIKWLLASGVRPRFYNECEIWSVFGEIVQNCRQHRLYPSSSNQVLPKT